MYMRQDGTELCKIGYRMEGLDLILEICKCHNCQAFLLQALQLERVHVVNHLLLPETASIL